MSKASYFKKGIAVITAAGVVAAMSCGTAFAASASNIASSTNGIKVDSNLLTTMGARAGSAGPDFLGISNMNYDFQPSHTANAGDPYPYYIEAGTNPVAGKTQSGTGYKADLAKADQFNRLAIWGSGVNTNANPYYQNLLADALTGTSTEGGLDQSVYTLATTYHSNQNSWGDVCVGTTSVISEDYEPDIIFGANKTTNWQDGDYAAGTYAKAAADAIEGYNPTYANNDSTNIWTQIYSLEQLGYTADLLTADSDKYTRYGDAIDSALAYEKSIKGQMLYVASQIDQQKTEKKKVAYLYAIDSEKGVAYFFVPTADGIASGNDTGSGVVSGQIDSTNQEEYAANNSTINMGYMATLPFITDTFGANGEATTREGGIQMIVEDIYKKNPVVTVTAGTEASDCMKDVDVIIYNSTKTTGCLGNGTKNGLCVDADVYNTAALTDENVAQWASAYGFTGDVLAGDDYGTSTQQNVSNAAVGATTGQAPMLYCARNYTVDKNARAAWAFSKVYPELYGDNDDASYAYWLENIYHIQPTQVKSVLAAYTHQSESTVDFSGKNTTTLDGYAEIGYEWYNSLGDNSVYKKYAYYNGSSRASYYGGTTTAEEPTDTIGIFEPSDVWDATEILSTENLVKQITEAEATIKEVQANLDSKTADLTQAQADLATAKQTLSDTQTKLDGAVATNNNLSAQISNLEDQVSDLNDELANAQNDVAVMARGNVSKTISLGKKTKTTKAYSISMSNKASENGSPVVYVKKSGNAKITVTKAGKVTLKKGVKKGTYKATIYVQCGTSSQTTITAKFVVK